MKTRSPKTADPRTSGLLRPAGTSRTAPDPWGYSPGRARFLYGVVALGITLAIAGCVYSVIAGVTGIKPAPAPHRNTDPRHGPVLVDTSRSIVKECDGHTLVYTGPVKAGGIAAVPNSPECQ